MAVDRLAQLAVGDCACTDDECGCVVVDSSLVFVSLSLLGPVLLAALAVLWLSVSGPVWVWAVLAVALVLLVVVLLDMPVSSAFSTDGVMRRTPLRDHQLPWDRIDSLGLTRTSRRPGVAAQVGRRTYLLAERVSMTRDELDLLARLRPSESGR